MPAAPLAANERERLRDLWHYRVLDTLPDPSFDGLTRLASLIAEAPIALISLTDEQRQWFKSRVGLDVPEIPREWAPCAHVVATGQSIICEDMRLDPRFSDNPLVLGPPHLRFYAGLALLTPRGSVLGTLAVIDTKPRSLTSAQSAGLATLAQQIVDQLELRTAYRELSQLRQQEKEFEARLLRERAEEAQRLAAELHDGAGQDLVGISIIVGALANDARKKRSSLAVPLEEVRLLLARAIDLCRGAAQDTGGFAIQHSGLSGALEQFVRRLDSPGGPRVELEAMKIPPPCLSDSAAYHLLRIAQEAILNAYRHSGARSIQIHCGHDAGAVNITVADDGVGLPTEGSPRGMGQKIMEYRARTLKADLQFLPLPNGGLKVSCRLPCAVSMPCADRCPVD
jgi:signal transduction histidine kinase